jgi:SAM-dependent methyltransferase
MIRAIFNANRRLSAALERRLPQARANPYDAYPRIVADRMNAKPRQLVVDVGGGKSCLFAAYRRPELETRIVAVDVSAEEIAQNRDVDETRVADVTKTLPFASGEVDMIVSRSVLEHLPDLEAFIVEAARVLKAGGARGGAGGEFIHLFPGRYALFALINRALPHRLSRRLLYFLQPQVAGICGFPAFYDRCNESAIRELLTRHGFEIERIDVNYHQSRYFDFFFPAFAASALYEMAVRALRIRDLGAYVTVIAQRK